MYTLLCTSYNRALLILGNLLSVGRLQSEPPYWVLFPGQRAYNRVSKLTLFVVSLNRKRFIAIRWNTLLITGSKSTQLDPKQEKNSNKTTLRVISPYLFWLGLSKRNPADSRLSWIVNLVHCLPMWKSMYFLCLGRCSYSHQDCQILTRRISHTDCPCNL